MCVLVILTWNTGCPKTCLRGHYSPQNATRSKSRVSFENLRKSSFWWALKFFGFELVGLRNWGLKLGTPCQKHDQIKLSSGSGLLSHNLKWKPCILGENIVILLVIYKIERLVTIPSLKLGKKCFWWKKIHLTRERIIWLLLELPSEVELVIFPCCVLLSFRKRGQNVAGYTWSGGMATTDFGSQKLRTLSRKPF